MKKLSVGNHSLRALAAAGCACVTVAAFAASDAAAISDDYCGVPKNLGDQCFQGGGYLAWRYHQASRGGLGDVPNLCAIKTERS